VLGLVLGFDYCWTAGIGLVGLEVGLALAAWAFLTGLLWVVRLFFSCVGVPL